MKTTTSLLGTLRQFMEPEKFNEYLKTCEEINLSIFISYLQPERTSEKDREKALDELVELSQELGLYDMRCSEHSNERE